jgi:hypothetical protein
MGGVLSAAAVFAVALAMRADSLPLCGDPATAGRAAASLVAWLLPTSFMLWLLLRGGIACGNQQADSA